MQARLLGCIRGQFCGDLDDKKWFSLRTWFRAYVILWPAKFMKGKGFILPPKRYEEIMRSIFDDVKRHSAQDVPSKIGTATCSNAFKITSLTIGRILSGSQIHPASSRGRA
jgi:hypothetical protein